MVAGLKAFIAISIFMDLKRQPNKKNLLAKKKFFFPLSYHFFHFLV
jgi:hypothetical protein